MTGFEELNRLRTAAQELREQGDLFGAERACLAVLEGGGDAVAHRELGIICWQEGRKAEALMHLGRAATLEPEGPAPDLLRQATRFFERQAPPEPKGALLVVVDYAVQPYNIGDLLIYMTGALVAAEEAGCDGIDWCFISDPKQVPQDPIMASLVSADNHLFHLMTFLPQIQLLPGLQEVHVFTDQEAFDRFVERRGLERPIWPTLEALRAKHYMFYDIFKLVHRFYAREGRIPALRFSDHLRSWAESFYRTHAVGRVPVTVNLRNNPHFHTHRNSNLAAWDALFRHCEGRLPVQFVITCASSEADDTLRSRSNVVFSKDSNTSVLQDLALIDGAAFHLGSPSGPAALPIFGTQPYFIFNCDMQPHLQAYDGALLETCEGELRYAFARGHQAFGLQAETAEVLIAGFERIWQSRDWVRDRSRRSPGGVEAKPTWMV
ncbi:MAG: hypothetical protein HYZ13_00125 [Acidobacteria bacterium]|nr:hypothetical protein [Acidobacteriota bacterium]